MSEKPLLSMEEQHALVHNNIAPVETTANQLTGKPVDRAAANTLKESAVDLLNRFRCIHIDDHGNQCDRWIILTPDCKRLCDAHDPNGPKTDSQIKEIKNFIDLQNNFRAKLHEWTFEERAKHIATIEEALEVMKTELLVTKALQSEAMANMTEEQRQKIRRVVVPRRSAAEVNASTKTSGSKAAPKNDEKQRIINDIFIGKYKMNAAQASACWNVYNSQKGKIDADKVAKMMLED